MRIENMIMHTVFAVSIVAYFLTDSMVAAMISLIAASMNLGIFIGARRKK